ncbi:hypothetical protein BA193_19450 [Yersinia pseudotuberculosis]|nr:hypothetical protein BLA52_07970 [Yersinia pseudotuberculosis]PSH25035.1 hypothetical protein BLA50_13965 [Yersinia pseudotuberculosis]PSH28618.1 hypothetical protein BLA51_17575 [Yersinia pseudotuberculosis]PSH33504.1 hypothetical protein BA197_15365 [Yersinia pseudotuberculosis]PSH40371.1 hypothetical protein BA193_19450 [Yersinia pseudotuberculosis]
MSAILHIFFQKHIDRLLAALIRKSGWLAVSVIHTLGISWVHKRELFCQYKFSRFGLAQLIAFALMDDKGYAVLSQQLFAGDRQRLTCHRIFGGRFVI